MDIRAKRHITFFLLGFVGVLSVRESLALTREEVKYKCSIEVANINDFDRQEKLYTQCIGFYKYVIEKSDCYRIENGGGRGQRYACFLDKPLYTQEELKRLNFKREKNAAEIQDRYERDRREREQALAKVGRKEVRLGGVKVTDYDGYLINNPVELQSADVLNSIKIAKIDGQSHPLKGIPLKPGVDYSQVFKALGHPSTWESSSGSSTNQSSPAADQNFQPKTQPPQPQQISKLDILKKNSQFILECIVVSQIFRRSAEAQNADSDLKKITSSLAGRYSEYGEQIFKMTDALKLKGDEIGEQFGNIDKDAQIRHWQRCNQWQP
jgi:hypothetical protein